jgi:hypothetical protein
VVVSLEGVNCTQGAKYITSHMQDVSCDKAYEVLESLNGNIGKAIDSLESGRESELVEVCCSICKALVEDSEYALLNCCSAFQKDRQSIVFASEFLKNIFRDALVYGNGVDLVTGKADVVRLLKSRLNQKKLIDLMDVCDTLKEMALMNCNNSLLITKICYSLRQAVGR